MPKKTARKVRRNNKILCNPLRSIRRRNPDNLSLLEFGRLPYPPNYKNLDTFEDLPYFEIAYYIGTNINSLIRFKSKSDAYSYYNNILSNYIINRGSLELSEVTKWGNGAKVHLLETSKLNNNELW